MVIQRVNDIQHFLIVGQVGSAFLAVQQEGVFLRQHDGQRAAVLVEQDLHMLEAELLTDIPDCFKGVSVGRGPASQDFRRDKPGYGRFFTLRVFPGFCDRQPEILVDLQIQQRRQDQQDQQKHPGDDLFSHTSSRKR